MDVVGTKLQAPRLRAGHTVARPDLERRLVAALGEQRLVMLCAPGGCGKTALLARALEQLPPGHGAAWIALDEGDGLHRLLHCLWQALEPFDLPWRTSPEGLATMAAATDARGQLQAADELVATLEAADLPHGVIVLDDLHRVVDEAAHAFLDRLLLRLGERWTLAFATRHEPPLRLARLRADGLLTELRAVDLQFSRDEAMAWLLPAGVEPAVAEAWHRRTMGWPAGLRLALGGARGARGVAGGGAIDRGAFDYLASEVVRDLDPGLRNFLLRTSVLRELDARRCEALTGDAQSWSQLQALERLDLFVSVVGEQPYTLRLHDLFRDALQHQLRLERPAEYRELVARAADQEDDLVRRQALLLAAGRLDDAAAALRRGSMRAMFGGGVHTVVHLAEQFPADFARASADLQDVAGYAKWRLWRNTEAAQHLEAAEALYRDRGDGPSARLAGLRRAAILAGTGRPRAARDVLQRIGEPPADEARAHSYLRLCRLWVALEEGASREVAPRLAEFIAALEQSGRPEDWAMMVPSPRMTACPGVGPLLLRWADAVSLAESESPLLLSALAPMTRGWQALWAGRLAEAERLLQRSASDERWIGHPPIVRSHRLAFTAVVQLALGRHAPALEAARAHGCEFPASYGGRGPWHALNLMGRVAAACGDAALLRDALDRLAQLDGTLAESIPLRRQPVLGLQGNLAWLEARGADAAALWRGALEHEQACDLFGLANELRTRLAHQRLRSRAPAEAAAVLVPMLEPDDGPRGALFALPELAELAAAPWDGALPAPALQTLRAWAGVAPPATAAAPSPSAPTAGDALSAREAEVLALAARGMTNKLIARELAISPHTVKRHVAHVLDKLGLASRSQAAAWYHAHAKR